MPSELDRKLHCPNIEKNYFFLQKTETRKTRETKMNADSLNLSLQRNSGCALCGLLAP